MRGKRRDPDELELEMGTSSSLLADMISMLPSCESCAVESVDQRKVRRNGNREVQSIVGKM